MGQLLSREDEDDCDQIPMEDQAPVNEEKEKPKRRQRNAGPTALRSRKAKPSGQGRTRRNRANPVTFDVNDY